jgi:hypothetical protein
VTESVLDKNQIIVGKPLPFSIYAADNTLLLAEGQIVKSESMKEALARGGARVSTRGAARPSAEAEQRVETEPTENPLIRFTSEHTKAAERWRPSLRMSRDDAGESYAVRVLAVTERNTLILTAPTRPDGTWVTVIEGQPWVFRTLYHTTALRFQAQILKAVFEPFPHLHVVVPPTIERRSVRKTARVVVAVPATLATPDPAPALIVDMSTGGARVAMGCAPELRDKQSLQCSFTLSMLERSFALDLHATVLAREPNPDPAHAGIAFYRLQFERVADHTALALHAYLNGVLAMDMDSFWRLVTINEAAQV